MSTRHSRLCFARIRSRRSHGAPVRDREARRSQIVALRSRHVGSASPARRLEADIGRLESPRDRSRRYRTDGGDAPRGRREVSQRSRFRVPADSRSSSTICRAIRLSCSSRGIDGSESRGDDCAGDPSSPSPIGRRRRAPSRRFFSAAINAASASIQPMLPVPTTNITSINAQQQPTQKHAVIDAEPERLARGRADRASAIRRSRTAFGIAREQRYLSALNWNRPAPASTAAPTIQPWIEKPGLAHRRAIERRVGDVRDAGRTRAMRRKSRRPRARHSRVASALPRVIWRNISSNGSVVGNIIAAIISTQPPACSSAGTTYAPCGIARHSAANAPSSR